MAEYIKLPFLETKISLLDLKNLENQGFLRSIFIELLKAVDFLRLLFCVF